MFKIVLNKPDMEFDMPNDLHLSLFDACDRAEIYKRHNHSATFKVVNEDNGDVEYEV